MTYHTYFYDLQPVMKNAFWIFFAASLVVSIICFIFHRVKKKPYRFNLMVIVFIPFTCIPSFCIDYAYNLMVFQLIAIVVYCLCIVVQIAFLLKEYNHIYLFVSIVNVAILLSMIVLFAFPQAGRVGIYYYGLEEMSYRLSSKFCMPSYLPKAFQDVEENDTQNNRVVYYADYVSRNYLSMIPPDEGIRNIKNYRIDLNRDFNIDEMHLRYRLYLTAHDLKTDAIKRRGELGGWDDFIVKDGFTIYIFNPTEKEAKKTVCVETDLQLDGILYDLKLSYTWDADVPLSTKELEDLKQSLIGEAPRIMRSLTTKF